MVEKRGKMNMGLFDKKVEFTCPICGKTDIEKKSLVESKNGNIPCSQCRNTAWKIIYRHLHDATHFITIKSSDDADMIKSIIYNEKKIREKAKSFEASNIGEKLQIDKKNKLLRRIIKENNGEIVDTFYDFSMIKGYEIIEDGALVTKGGLGSAIAGGILFGEVGAIVGATTGKKTTKEVCQSLELYIYTEYPLDSTIKIPYIKEETRIGSFAYKKIKSGFDKDFALIRYICDGEEPNDNQLTNQSVNMQSTLSVADEIKKFKELLDMGAITQEEFDAKKKQLLGL